MKKDFEKLAIGKNVHSVLVRCLECRTWGIYKPPNKMCGDCGSPDGVTYYDSETINNILNEKI